MGNFENIAIVIPACGTSERFKSVGIDTPKSLIRFSTGQPGSYCTMLDNVMRGMSPQQMVIAVRKEDRTVFRKNFPMSIVAPVGISLGQAHSVEIAVSYLDPDASVLVLNCDGGFRYPLDSFIKQAKNFEAAALVFNGEGETCYSYINDFPMFSFAEEKNVISDWALAGAYYFNNVERLRNAVAEQLTQNSPHKNGEFYLSGTFKYMMGGKLAVSMPRSYLLNWGTPEDLARDPEVECESPEIRKILQRYI